MPDKKITELTETTTATGADLIPIVTDVATTPVTKKILVGNLSATAFVSNEVPGGSVNSSNVDFTAAASMTSGTLKVYQNGVRMKGGGVDFTQGSGVNFSFVTAPLTGDLILIDYQTNSGAFSTGSTSFIYNEVPTGLVNGSNTAYDTAHTFVSGSIQVYRDGQLMKGGGADYTETDSNTITFTTAPVTDSVILVTYQSAVSAAGNADTVDGVHASDIPVDGQLIADYGGWQKVNGSWSYASASTITVPSGAASYYQKGDRIRWKQGAGYKYGVIVTVADTLLTIAVNTDYTVANSAITDIYFSHQANPIGYPTSFNFTGSYAFAAGTAPSGALVVDAQQYQIVGGLVFINCLVEYTTAGATATGLTLTLPITSSEALLTGSGYTRDGSAVNRAMERAIIASTTTFAAGFASQTLKQFGINVCYPL
jgi:hypothetical protein